MMMCATCWQARHVVRIEHVRAWGGSRHNRDEHDQKAHMRDNNHIKFYPVSVDSDGVTINCQAHTFTAKSSISLSEEIRWNRVITHPGYTVETYDDSVIQLDYKSNILGEIDKIETCHSTYAILNYYQNKALCGLSDVFQTTVQWKYKSFIPMLNYFSTGFKIADTGQIYGRCSTRWDFLYIVWFESGMFSSSEKELKTTTENCRLASKSEDTNILEYLKHAAYTGEVIRLPGNLERVKLHLQHDVELIQKAQKSVSDQRI